MTRSLDGWRRLVVARNIASFVVVVSGVTGPACAKTDPEPQKVPVTEYAEKICKDVESCCRGTGYGFEHASCEASVAQWISVDDPERAAGCARLIEARSAGCDACRTKFENDELADACNGEPYWGWTEGNLNIGARALSRGGGSHKIGEPCTSSVECEAESEGYVRCVEWKEVTGPNFDVVKRTGSFCQAVMTMEPQGQHCLTAGWTPVGPGSLQELTEAFNADKADRVTECGLPGSKTICTSGGATENGSCIARAQAGDPCTTPSNQIMLLCDDGTHCDLPTNLCVADDPGATCPLAERNWAYSMCVFDAPDAG